MMQISEILEQDFEEIFTIEQKAFEEPWTLGMLKNCFGKQYLNLKLTIDNKIIGYVLCHYLFDEASIFNIAIDPTYQGQGLSKKLLDHLTTILKKHKISSIFLEVRVSNQVAINLYKSFEFEQIGFRKNYYRYSDGSSEDAIVMMRTL